MDELKRQRKERCQVCPIDIAHVLKGQSGAQAVLEGCTHSSGCSASKWLLTLAARGLGGKLATHGERAESYKPVSGNFQLYPYHTGAFTSSCRTPSPLNLIL